MGSSADRAPRVAFVMGDPAGISPELAARLLSDEGIRGSAAILVIGDRRVLSEGERHAGVKVEIESVDAPAEATPGRPLFYDLHNCDPADITIAEASAAGGAFALANFRAGLELARAGQADVVYFTPFNKLALHLGGNPFADELNFAADLFAHKGPVFEFNLLDGLWNARVTSHIPLRDVADALTVDKIVSALQRTDQAMQTAGFANPRIALAALNPHAGDGGKFGREEIDILEPAIAEAQRLGVNVQGPFPSDTVFLRAKAGQFDAVQTLFHDQGQIAIKMMGFERGVTVLGGLPVPLCTPAHGTAYDIAGQGVANVEAARQAFHVACDMGARNAATRQAA